eukprot:Tbor_TRINITY_DN5417_c3_g3::TRINITY_DN5417_c3_g3_i1::g.24992::m.24992/K15275/SLC35B1; solute carrier family 35 (UDP-galactose transporter), member B1
MAPYEMSQDATSKNNRSNTSTEIKSIAKARKNNSPPQGSSFLALMELLFCAGGIYTSFFLWGLLQEKIATKKYSESNGGNKELFTYPLVTSLMVSVGSLVVAGLVRIFSAMWNGNSSLFMSLLVVIGLRNKEIEKYKNVGSEKCKDEGNVRPKVVRQTKKRHLSFETLIPFIPSLALIGFAITFATPLGFAAMHRIPYPFVITIKMCKLVPIIVVGTLWHKTHYSSGKYLVCFLVTTGVVMFSYFDWQKTTELQMKKMKNESFKISSDIPAETSHVYGTLGIIFVVMNLLFDGLVSSSQDVITKGLDITANDLQLMTHGSSFIWSFGTLMILELCKMFTDGNTFINPQLSPAILFFQKHPSALQDAILMGILHAVGQIFIFRTISAFGAFTLAAITVTRKAGSVLLSILINGHVLGMGQSTALGIVMIGVVLEAVENVQTMRKKMHDRELLSEEKKKD